MLPCSCFFISKVSYIIVMDDSSNCINPKEKGPLLFAIVEQRRTNSIVTRINIKSHSAVFHVDQHRVYSHSHSLCFLQLLVSFYAFYIISSFGLIVIVFIKWLYLFCFILFDQRKENRVSSLRDTSLSLCLQLNSVCSESYCCTSFCMFSIFSKSCNPSPIFMSWYKRCLIYSWPKTKVK